MSNRRAGTEFAAWVYSNYEDVFNEAMEAMYEEATEDRPWLAALMIFKEQARRASEIENSKPAPKPRKNGAGRKKKKAAESTQTASE